MEEDIIINELINKDVFIKMLDEYYSVKMRRDVHFTYKLGIIYTDISAVPDIKIYLNNYIMGDKISVQVTDDEVKEVLDVYAKNHGNILESFKYRGSVRKMGVYADEDTPIFEGVFLKMKKLGKTRTRKK